MKPTAKHQEDFLAGRQVLGVAIEHNSPVEVVGGHHAGASGSVISVEELGSDPTYLVELNSGQDVLIRQSSLRVRNAPLTNSASELLRAQWQAVAQRLGIKAAGPVRVVSPSGGSYEFAVLLPQFGSRQGMLISPEHSPEAFAAAMAAGYGATSYAPDPAENPGSDLESYIDCLRDWEWSEMSQPPAWYHGRQEG